MTRHPPGLRTDYRFFHEITTRWHDNDPFRHVNNVVYFAYFDTAVTYFEITAGIIDLLEGNPYIAWWRRVCAAYHKPVAPS